MLRGLRKASSNWLGKAVMAAVVGFLVISFAIWGIGDIFRGFGRSTVAKIGHTEITIEQFRQLYNDRLQQYARQLGRPISSDQARALGLDRLVVASSSPKSCSTNAPARCGLGLTDAEVAQQHHHRSRLSSGPNGQFDRFRFEAMIRQAGFTEPRFVAEQRRQLLRRQLGGTIVDRIERAEGGGRGGQPLSERATLDRIRAARPRAGRRNSRARRRKRSRKYFEERKILFRAPEYRKLVIVSLIPSEQAQWIEISDADLKRAYEERRARYVTPERRHIQQIDLSQLPRRRTPPQSASPRARPSSRSPRSAARPRRTSISAR